MTEIRPSMWQKSVNANIINIIRRCVFQAGTPRVPVPKWNSSHARIVEPKRIGMGIALRAHTRRRTHRRIRAPAHLRTHARGGLGGVEDALVEVTTSLPNCFVKSIGIFPCQHRGVHNMNHSVWMCESVRSAHATIYLLLITSCCISATIYQLEMLSDVGFGPHGRFVVWGYGGTWSMVKCPPAGRVCAHGHSVTWHPLCYRCTGVHKMNTAVYV